MKAEHIDAIPLSKDEALSYARLAAGEYRHTKIEKAKYLGGGSFGRAVGITFSDGQKIVVKILRADGMLEKESFDLALLKRHCTEKIPEVLFVRKKDSKLPLDCYGMEHIEGKNALMALGMLFLTKKRRLEFADRVTDALHSLHTCQSDRFGDTQSPDCTTWQEFYRPFAEQVLKKAEELGKDGKLGADVVSTMQSAWKKFDVIFSENVEKACLIHGDLNVANIMVGKKYKVTGFIDPLNSMYADREYDLFQFDNLTGKRFFLRETYLKKYGASKYCMQKLAFYGLWNEVFCYIRSGALFNIILKPLVKNMKRRLKEL